MEQTEQINGQTNTKKPKKKGKIILGIILAIIIIAIIALVAVYFLVFSTPQYIFASTVDSIFNMKAQTYNTVKSAVTLNGSVQFEDESINEQLTDLENFSINIGSQIDYQNQSEIVDLGLQYEDESVVGARFYFKDGEMYTLLDGLYDDYIKVDLDTEQANLMQELLDLTKVQGKQENLIKAMSIFGNEIKGQISNVGTFEKSTEQMTLNGENKNVTRVSLLFNAQEFSTVVINVCNNLANNNEFIQCFEESPKDALLDIVASLEDGEPSSDDTVRISIYTQGLLNETIGFGLDLNLADNTELSINMNIMKETDDLYTVSYTQGDNYINGRIEIARAENTEENQTGDAKITLEVSNLGTMELNMGYAYSYNQAVDEVDTRNSVNAEDLTQEDMNTILENLMERPIIGDLMTNIISSSMNNNSNTLGTTTLQNQVSDNSYIVTYEIPTEFMYDSSLSTDSLKSFTTINNDIQASTSIKYYTDDQAYINLVDNNYSIYTNNTFYHNVSVSDLQTLSVGNYEFKYKSISYETTTGSVNQSISLWYRLNNEYIYTVDINSIGTTISDDIIMPFLNIQVQNQ